MNRQADAKRPDLKTPRVGANRRKLLDEQRAKRPRLIARAVKRAFKIAAIITLAAAAVYAAYAYGPAVSANLSYAVKSGKRLPANVIIINGDNLTRARLKGALDSLLSADAAGFDRARILSAAAAIPDIEKISVGKIKDRRSREISTLIKITERKPVALVHCGNVFLVDKNGIKFSPRQGRFYDLPLLVVGETAAVDTVDMEVFNSVKRTSRNLGAAFFQQISQIDVSGDSSVTLRFKSGEAEYVMGYGDIEGRMAHVKRLRERLIEGLGGPARVDLRYRGLAFASAL